MENYVPEGQKCRRELEEKNLPAEKCADATTDYNGHGYWVCAHCNKMLNEEFDRDFD